LKPIFNEAAYRDETLLWRAKPHCESALRVVCLT
jgi:hypothetical protein